MTDKIDWDAIWKRAEADQVRRERFSRIRRGRIVPAFQMKPQLMIKDATGRWCPKLEVHA